MSINVTVSGNRCSRRYLLADRDLTKKNEFNRRRKLRIEQVRQQSKDLASHLRQEFRKEREKQINKFEQEQISELAKWQARKLLSLQEKYQECISQVGTGHRQAAEEPDYGTILAEQKNRNLDAAKQRGKIANEKARKESEEALAKANEVTERLKLKKTVEDLRSTMISSIGKNIRTTKTVDRPLQEITVNVPGDGRQPRIRSIRTVSSGDQQETIVKTFYKGASPSKPKVKQKSPPKASKKGTGGLTLDLTELNKSGTSFDRSDVAESLPDVSEITARTYTKTTSNVDETRQHVTHRRARNVPFQQLPTVNLSDVDEETDQLDQESEGPRTRSNRQDSRVAADDNTETRGASVQGGTAKPTKEKPRVLPRGRGTTARKQQDSTQVQSTRGKPASAKQGQSCYCPENPGPSTESSSDPSDPPPPRYVTSASTDVSGAGKVQMYNHSARYHREYKAPSVVERVPRGEETSTLSSSEHTSHAALAMRQAQAAADALRTQEAVARQRGQQAVNREAVRRDYAKLMGDLQTLSREERLARGSIPSGAAAEVHLSDGRRRELADVRQRNMDSAFEAVLHRTVLPSHDASEIESTTTTIRHSSASRHLSPPPTPAQLNVGALPAPVPAPKPRSPEPKFVFVIPYSPQFSETSIVVGVDPNDPGQQDRTDGPEDASKGRKRLEMEREGRGRGSPEGSKRQAGCKSPSPGRISPDGHKRHPSGSPQPARKGKSPERSRRKSPELPTSPRKSRESPSPDSARPKFPRQTGTKTSPSKQKGRSSPTKSGRGSPQSVQTRTPSPGSASPSIIQESSTSLDLISLEALMDRVHAQRALLLEEVGRDVLAALPRDAPFLKRPTDAVVLDSPHSSESSVDTVEYLATKVKQVWTKSTSEAEPVRPPAKPSSKRSRKKQRREATDTDTVASVSQSLAEGSETVNSSETSSFEGVQVVVSVRDRSPRRQARVDGEGQAQGAEHDEPDRAAQGPPKKSPKKSPKPRRAPESTSTSYASPPDRLNPRKTNVLSSLLRTIGQQQEKLDEWRASIVALKPTPSLEAYVDRLLGMGERSMDLLSDASHVSTPASSVVNDPGNAVDQLDSLLRDRVDDIAQELRGLQESEGEGELLRLVAERVRRRRAEEGRQGETQRRPKEDVRRTSLEKRQGQVDERPATGLRLIDREKVHTERISSLAEQIEQVRLERQIIVDSSASGGTSTRDSTRYESPPLELKSPVLVPLSPRAARSLASPRSNGNDETRYASPPASVVTPSLLATRLSPPPTTGTSFPGAAPASPTHYDTRTANRHKPPASMWRTGARGAPTWPHELSAIAEVETPRHEVSDLPDVMAEMMRRQLITSPLHFARANSTAVTASSVGDRTASYGSPTEDLGSELTRLGFGWASATLRKTQATRDLSSSSSPESFGRPPRRSATTTTPAQTSRERSGQGSPTQTSRERSSLRSPPRTSRDRSTPVHMSDGSQTSPFSFRADTDLSTVRGTGSEGGKS